MQISPPFFRRFFVVLACCIPAAAAQAQEDPELAETLRVSHMQWIADAEFIGTFKTYLGTAESVAAAAGLTADDLDPEAEGTFAKSGETLRMTYVPVSGAVQLDDNKWKNIPQDEVSNGRIQIRFELPNQRTESTTLHVENKDDDVKRPYRAGMATAGVLNPLAIAGRASADPFSFGNDDGTITGVEQSDDGTKVSVNLTLDAPPLKRLKTVTFSTDGPVPVISEVRTRTEHDDGRWTETITVGRGFTDCSGLPVAREVLYAMNAKDRGECKVRLFVSEDLGDRAPVPEDFVVTVPKQCRIRGLKERLPPGTERTVDISTIAVADLRELARPTVNTQNAARSKMTGQFLVIANLLIAVVIGIIWFVRSRRSAA